MKCMICGKEVKHNHYSEHSDFFGLCGDEKCFSKRFWQLALDDSAVIIKGVCYHIGKEPKDLVNTYELGYGGMKFRIKMLNTGKVFTTHNLRYNGDIPKEYAIKDNAVFLGV